MASNKRHSLQHAGRPPSPSRAVRAPAHLLFSWWALAICSAAISTFSSQATAQAAPPPALPQAVLPASPQAGNCCAADERNWPDGPHQRKKVHLFASGQIGSCTRDNTEVGVTEVCGDIVPLGIDLPFLILGEPFRFSVEGAFGATSKVESGDAFGIRRSSGGPYLALRLLFGYDITRRFFVRWGSQVRGTWSLDTVAPGVMGVIDLGTRIGSRLELGPRAFFGADGVASVNSHGANHDLAFAFGTTLVARVFVH